MYTETPSVGSSLQAEGSSTYAEVFAIGEAAAQDGGLLDLVGLDAREEDDLVTGGQDPGDR